MNQFHGRGLASASIALGILLAFHSNTASAEEKGPAGPVKWEYKIVPETTWIAQPDKSLKVVRVTEEVLNKLGEEGWQLSGVVNKTSGRSSAGAGEIATEVYFIFQRPKR
jgi:hypothetical protein